MNKQRRKEISECIKELEILNDKLIDIKDDEQMAFDSLPENLQGSMKGEEMEESIEYMENALEYIDNVLDELNNIN